MVCFLDYRTKCPTMRIQLQTKHSPVRGSWKLRPQHTTEQGTERAWPLHFHRNSVLWMASNANKKEGPLNDGSRRLFGVHCLAGGGLQLKPKLDQKETGHVVHPSSSGKGGNENFWKAVISLQMPDKPACD